MPQRCSTPSSGDIGLGLARHTRLGACLFPKELHVQNQPDGDDDSEEEIILKITRLPYGARNMGLTDEEEDEEWQYQGPYLEKGEGDASFWNDESPSFRTDIFGIVKASDNDSKSKSNTGLISSPISPKTIPKHSYLDSEDLICLSPVEENDSNIDVDMPGRNRKRKYEHFSADTAKAQTKTQNNAFLHPKCPPNPHSRSRNPNP